MKKVNWKNETEVLKEIDTFIKNNGGLLINCRGKDRWYNIIKYCKKYNYNIDDLCARLGYDYARLPATARTGRDAETDAATADGYAGSARSDEDEWHATAARHQTGSGTTEYASQAAGYAEQDD